MLEWANFGTVKKPQWKLLDYKGRPRVCDTSASRHEFKNLDRK